MRLPASCALVLVGSTALLACSAPTLTPMGRGVVAMASPPPGRCAPLGPVTGEGRGAYSSGSLIEYATNDARNQAAALGATHLHTTLPTLAYSANQYGGGVTGATVTGTAYRCVGPEHLAAPPPTRGIYAALAPMPPPPPADAPLLVSATPAVATDADAAVRAALDARRQEILTCAGRDMVAVDATGAADGALAVSLAGELAGSAAEGCVRAALGSLRVDGVSVGERVRHLVR